MLAAVEEFERQGIRICDAYGSPDWIVGRMRQARISGGLYTTDLNAAVKRLKRAGKLIKVRAGSYERRQPRYSLCVAPNCAHENQ